MTPESAGRPRPARVPSTAGESFAWPPPDDALAKITVVDLASGEEALPATLSAAEVQSESPASTDRPDTALLDIPGRVPGFDVHRFQQAQAAADAVDSSLPGSASASPIHRKGAHRRPGMQPGRSTEWSSSAPGSLSAAIASLRRLPLTRMHWALAVAIAIMIAQAAFIITRLAQYPAARQEERSPGTSTPVNPSAAAPASFPVHAGPVSTLGSPAASAGLTDAKPVVTSERTARLVIRSEPPGAKVTVDGRARGVAPLTLRGLAPGAHKVVVHGPGGDVEHAISAEAGATMTVVASLPVGTAAGWIAVSSPTLLQILEGNELLGTSASPRVMVPAGRHTVDLVNEELGYRSQQVLDVVAGEISRLAPEMPNGTVHLNALPWAEVWIGGRKIGDTPIGNLQLPIGSHEVVFRNPDLGEAKRTVLATLHGPARVSVNLERDRN